MKILIVCKGYVGLVTGACLADLDQKRIDNLKKGFLPIFEPDLNAKVNSNFS